MEKSIKYTDEAVEQVIEWLSKIEADMDGTEILQPMQFCINLPSIENHQRIVFLLTDGSVSNSDEVVELIQKSAAGNKIRVFSIGIGNGCSEVFIRNTAKAGHGRYILVPDNSDDL